MLATAMRTLPRIPEAAPMADEYDLYTEVNDQYNTLIAGTIGSGKSVFEHGMIYNLVNNYTPDECELYLIDPKRVELIDFIGYPHVKGYARETGEAVDMLEKIERIVLDRYDEMAQMRMKKYAGNHVYVFIDELAYVMTSKVRKTSTELLARIMMLGRAAKVHIVACTQSPSRNTIPAEIQTDITCRVGLRCEDRIESRQVVKMSGCEELPEYGMCIVKHGTVCEKREVPMYSDMHYALMERYWLGVK